MGRAAEDLPAQSNGSGTRTTLRLLLSLGHARFETEPRGRSVELAPRGITVNCLAPAVIVTDMLLETMKIHEEQAEKIFSEQIPLGRTGTPEDCAAAAVFFASPAARWITGQFIDVAGGQPT